jgi:hypothetical protein
MAIPNVCWRRCGRALFVVLALVANFVATGVPLLHALAHEHVHREAHAHGQEYAHQDHHPPSGHGHQDHHAPSGHGDEHDEIHPASLHDECLVVPRAGFDFVVALIPESSPEPTALVVAEAPFVESSALHSRAPPRTTLARAPPLV